MSRIVLFSRPVRSGKTSSLLEHLDQFGQAGGLLCPDIDGLRRLMILPSRQLHDFQTLTPQDGNTVRIGRFDFLRSAFELARQSLIRAADELPPYCLVDEVGKLEYLRRDGLEPALSILIKAWKDSEREATLLLVVRDFLLDEVVEQYDLHNAEIIHQIEPWLNK